MKLPSLKRIMSQDFETQYKTLIETLAGILNIAIESIYGALNNNLTIRENFSASIKDVTLSVNSDGIPIGGSSFKIDFNKKVEGLMVLSADNQVNSTVYPTSGVFINYTQNSLIVTINHVTGLQPGTSYTLRVVAFLQ